MTNIVSVFVGGKVMRLRSRSSITIRWAKEMKSEVHIPNVHPGLVLADELEERNISQSFLAEHIGVLPKTINEICRGKRGISAEMAWKLSRSLGASPNFWLNLQNNWELTEVKRERFEKLKKIAA